MVASLLPVWMTCGGLVQAPKKKIRLGLPATQWITVYNAHRPMKQRYHYNVANTRVDQHVEKGNDDGLYISSVACCHELWALIMDAGTGFTAQVTLCFDFKFRFLHVIGVLPQQDVAWAASIELTVSAGCCCWLVWRSSVSKRCSKLRGVLLARRCTS